MKYSECVLHREHGGFELIPRIREVRLRSHGECIQKLTKLPLKLNCLICNASSFAHNRNRDDAFVNNDNNNVCYR